MLSFHYVGHTTLARLAVDSDDCFVGAPHMLGVKRQVRHFPLLVVLCQCIETFFDCILMAAGKRGVHQVACVGLPFGHGQTVAVFGIAPQSVDVAEVKHRVDAVDEQVHRQGDHVDVACAFAVAKQRAFHAISTGHDAKLGGSHGTAAIVVRVQ